MSTRTYRLLNLLLLAAFYAGSAMAYPALPDRIPRHFDLSGRPDAWEPRSLALWLALPVIATATAALLEGMSRAGTRTPELWNVPEKRWFLQLSPHERAPIVQRLQRFMAFTGVMVTGLMMVVQAAVYLAATRPGNASPLPLTGATGGFVAVLVLSGIRMNRHVRGLIHQAHHRTAPS